MPAPVGRSARFGFAAGVALVAALFLIGGWQRRWIADDGLIVLRTVRNLAAGNGPVFNAGERVETNTSAAWTYLVYAGSWLSQVRLEYVVLTITLALSVGAVVCAMLGAGRFWGGPASGVLVPAGGLVYIAIPPARDYATSGLESSLVLCWIGALWLLSIRWAQADRVRLPSVLGLAFTAGLGPLIRPEMAVVGALVLLLVFCAPMPGGLRTRAAFVAVAGALPLGYQIWRMGYYALPYPNTAVAKDAAGSKWNQGFAYLADLVGPYWLWLPLLILAGLAVLAVRSGVQVSGPQVSGRRRLRSPRAVVGVLYLCALLLLGYSLRVGGDFMHGRMLLPVVFLLLLPVAVLPVPVTGSLTRARAVTVAGGLVVLGWAAIAANTHATGTQIGKTGIVDERAYYSLYTGHAHPIRAEDYLDYPRMRPMVAAIAATPDGGLLVNTPGFTSWDVIPPPAPVPPEGVGHTVYFLNLGMTSMNVPLEVRVLDPMGLAYPLAAHSDRLTDGRIGHDKSLFADWAIADLDLVDEHPWLPAYFDRNWVRQAQVALTCPETRDLLTSYRSQLTWDRWKQNLKRSFEFADYRIDRVPKYDIERCGLQIPPETTP
ncbi:hypothetical protein KV203_00890 [Skermania piniformis]|uniref:Terminal beta-(1->2)-arabinofuranosyltransferase C-terminal domain-containing protein n=1 Tax=Skermania pinensis TaxID=39122 RepID=A0ABX8SGM1_9ACTN|nr:flagellar motor control protein ZomB [Skermania piniformis]QXQ15585.1 hypothetical protein KV203_00890 [Skermania piniformis]